MDTLTPRHLLIGDEQDLPLLRLLLSGFPWDSVGELVIELPARRHPLIAAPPGIAQHVVVTAPHEPRGLRACTALDAWVSEWVLGERASAEGHAIFLGMAGNALVESRCEALLARHPRLHMHRPSPAGALP